MYNYEIERPKIFTEEGQKDFLKIRDNVNNLLRKSTYFKLTEAF